MKISYSIGGQRRQTTVSELLRLFDQLQASAASHPCLSVHYNSKHLHIYFRDGGDPRKRVGVQFAGPGELDGGGGSVEVETAKAALTAIGDGVDPEMETRRASSDWQTYREYEGLD